MANGSLISQNNRHLSTSTDVNNLLDEIRPSWQAKGLIKRVKAILPVDPSSACQKIFNAAIHDLREKIILIGIDIAKAVADEFKLPSISKAEDLENYSTTNLITLAFRIGFLSRIEWRRICRCYDIRKDLEHEDDEYEASLEDCIYIFKICIEVVLSKDPINLIKLSEVKSTIEQPILIVPSETILRDYAGVPQPRQEEILQFLISISLNEKQPDILRKNAIAFLKATKQYTQTSVLLSLTNSYQERLGRAGLDYIKIRVAYSSGILPYLKQTIVTDYFLTVLREMEKIGGHWSKNEEHGPLLRKFQKVGGLVACPPKVRTKILGWLIETYVGEIGGATRYGYVREVFYSNTAAPLIEELIEDAGSVIAEELSTKKKSSNTHLAKRLENLQNIVNDIVKY